MNPQHTNVFKLLGASALNVGVLLLTGCAHHETPTTSVSLASDSNIDVHNTACPVSGEEVGYSTISTVYQGKVYHFCCMSCSQKFLSDPDKYIAQMNANPAKYGLKQPL